MKYVLDTNLTSKNIDFLKNMYEDLKNNELLKFDNLFKDYLQSVDIVGFK